MCLIALCIGVFRIIFMRNERLLIAFFVRLICYMVLPHYCAVRLKCILIVLHIYFYINILLVFYEYILQQYKEQYIIFYQINPMLIHFSLFPPKKCSNKF